MKDIAIKVEKLGKAYTIGQTRDNFRNTFGKKLRNVMSGANYKKEIFQALDDVSFTINQGDSLAIIGKNGAGKSTLLKILSRITEPSAGSFEINGKVSSLLEVGTGFHMELTGRENIFLNGIILGMRKAEVAKKFDEIVSFSGVEKFLNTPVKHYSSGMKVRLAFSVAAHLEPEILIVDEVLAVGDAEFQRKCIGKMDEVASTGRTVLFVSHNMGSLRKLCSKGLLLDNGKLTYFGKVEDTIKNYLQQGQNTIDRGLTYEDDLITLSGIRLSQDGHDTLDVVDSKFDLMLHLHYSIKREIIPMRIKLRLIHFGQIIFQTDDTAGMQEREKKVPGDYEMTFTIPSNLLHIIGYSIQIGIDIPEDRELLHFTKVAEFMVVDSTGNYKYSKNWPGVIRPVLPLNELRKK